MRESRKARWALIAMLGAAAMDLIDTTIVNVAAPAIREDLGADPAQIEASVAAYALTFGVGLITGARVGDRLGRRPVFLAGIAAFLLASLACGLAPNVAVLIGARAAQGGAAALMIPQILTMIQVEIPPERRSTAFAAYGATAAIGTVSGPLLGGLLVTADVLGLGWRSIFLINVPIGLVVLAVAAATLPDSRAPHGARLDLVGTALLTVGLLLLMVPLAAGPQHGWPWWTVLALICTAPAFALFAAQQRRAGAPLVPPHLFGRPGFLGGALSQVMLYAGVTGFFLVLAVALQTGLGFSALGTGLTLVAWSVGIAAASGAAGVLASRFGRRLTIAGALTMAAGMCALLIAFSGPGAGPGGWALVPGLFIAGVGMGLVAPILVDLSLRSIDPADAGAASGVITTAGQIGGALGVAAIGAVYFGTLQPAGGLRALTTVLWCEAALFTLAAVVMLLIPQDAHRRIGVGTPDP